MYALGYIEYAVHSVEHSYLGAARQITDCTLLASPYRRVLSLHALWKVALGSSCSPSLSVLVDALHVPHASKQ